MLGSTFSAFALIISIVVSPAEAGVPACFQAWYERITGITPKETAAVVPPPAVNLPIAQTPQKKPTAPEDRAVRELVQNVNSNPYRVNARDDSAANPKMEAAKLDSGAEIVPDMANLKPVRPLPREIGNSGFAKLPSLSAMLAESRGITRPPRVLPKPLQPIIDGPSLSFDAFMQVLYRVAQARNWSDVAYAASGRKSIESHLEAQWMKEDLALDVREYMAMLNPLQQKIIHEAFRRGAAEGQIMSPPAEITLEWVLETFPNVIHGN